MKKLRYNLDMLFADIYSGGATYHYNETGFEKNPRTGCVVGMNNYVATFNINKCGREVMGEMMLAVKHCNNIIDTIQASECLGLWVDKRTHTLYVEKTIIYDDREKAVAVAEFYDEIAIWDCGNQEEISIK